jgi:predicted dehydrogenase
MQYALLGLGFMGSTHLKGWSQLPDAQLVAVASDDPVKLTGDLSGVQGNIGGPGERYDFSALGRYLRWEEAIEHPGVEAVDVCLPTNLHAPAALAALRAGKHVLVEKPMALDAGQAREMVREAEARGLILMTAQVLRFFPMYQRLRELVKSGELGAVRSAIFRRRCAAPAWSQWLADASVSGGGVFDLLIHDVDVCVHVFGAPRAVRARGHEDLKRGIDWILAEFEYEGGATVVVTGGWHHPKSYPFSMEFTVVGDNGTMEYSSAGREPTFYRADGSEQALDNTGPDGYQAEVAYFLECCRTGRKPELCPPGESALSVELAALMLESRKRNGERISCDR